MIHGTHNALPDERNQDILIFINDELLPRADAKISVFDSGYLVGDGIWEALRLHEGVLVFLDQHLDRLWTALRTLYPEHAPVAACTRLMDDAGFAARFAEVMRRRDTPMWTMLQSRLQDLEARHAA